MFHGGSYLIGFIAQVILGIAGWHIAKKAGYAPAWGLLAIVPVVSYIVIIYFAFNIWPIEKELQDLKNKE
ncbi:MAG: hypothetical protein PHC34_01695 [Candidatus Gastranaerophilales bacterium]|nr:hypothetical protein [Candidatus Gastranaerophilales bacterium]